MADVLQMSANRAAHARIAIVIPAFNEGAVIADVIRNVRSVCPYVIYVVDDFSTDNTIAAAESGGAIVIPLASQLGAWGATQTGLRYALRHGVDTVISMDADGQHEAESIPGLLEPVLNDGADVVIGACPQRGSVMRKIAWRLMKQVSGLRLEDITSGFRVYNYRAIRELASWRATLLDYQDVAFSCFCNPKACAYSTNPCRCCRDTTVNPEFFARGSSLGIT